MGAWRAGHRDLPVVGDRSPRINVSDESWYRMRLGDAAVQDMDSEMRLTRSATGDIEWMVLHKPSDLLSAGDLGSRASTIAKGLLHLADGRILYWQDEEVGQELGALLSLNPLVQDLVTGWANAAPGRGVWMIGANPYAVHTALHPLERRLTWTNEHLQAVPRASNDSHR